MISAEKLISEIKSGKSDFQFVEVMACPGGCVNGGGQPIPARKEDIKGRIKCIYDVDDKESIKFAHKNPQVNEIYKTYLENTEDNNLQKLLTISEKYFCRVIE